MSNILNKRSFNKKERSMNTYIINMYIFYPHMHARPHTQRLLPSSFSTSEGEPHWDSERLNFKCSQLIQGKAVSSGTWLRKGLIKHLRKHTSVCGSKDLCFSDSVTLLDADRGAYHSCGITSQSRAVMAAVIPCVGGTALLLWLIQHL